MTENGEPSEARGRTVLVGLDLLVSLWLWCRRWNVLTRVHGRLGWTACDGDTPFFVSWHFFWRLFVCFC